MPVIAIISQKGGAGKTTLALHLAAEAERLGLTSLIIDTDPQATASQWAEWREHRAPEVIDSLAATLPRKIEAAKAQGAEFIVIDTPPHAHSEATAAARLADFILIPCRPSAFDLAAIQTTAQLVTDTLNKPAAVVFTAGNANAPRTYEEAAAVVADFGLEACPIHVADRAVFRRACAEGKTAQEIEPKGKAAEEIQAFYKWISERVNLRTSAPKRKKAAA